MELSNQSKEKYLIISPSFEVHNPEDYKFGQKEKDFEYLVRKEALKETVSQRKTPDAIEYFKRFGIDWEKMSDIGHMHYQPQACLMFDIISDYAWQKVNSLGIPVYPIKGTNMFRLSEKPIKEHADLFGERLYEFELDNEKFVLRYAACHQAFAMMKDWKINYKQLPFGVFENADSYRLEQSGELLLGFRTRKMNMPDLHILTKDVNHAKEFTLKIHKKIFEEYEDNLGRELFSLYNITPSFFNENQEYIKKLLKIERKSILLKFAPEGKYYWTINVEHHIIDTTNSPREIATFQIDVGNSDRFGITYLDCTGDEKHMPIIHTALIGTIERYLYTIFDTVAKQRLQGKKPSLPLWLSPTQVRVIPVSGAYVDYADELAEKIQSQRVRADIDDREESVGKKIFKAERELVPYTIVLGEKEKTSEEYPVRVRETKSIKQMPLNQLINEIYEKTNEKPFRNSYLPKEVSLRTIF